MGRVEQSVWIFHVDFLALQFLGALLRSYPSIDAIREDHPNGIVIVALGESSPDIGKTDRDYRVIFSAAAPWKNQ